jgi:hypothetical protein
MKHRWNNTGRENPKYLEEKPARVSFVNHRFHINWPTIETGPTANSLRNCHGLTAAEDTRHFDVHSYTS